MIPSKRGSYYEEFRKKAGVPPNRAEMERLMTDRSSYISFLEVQLERVSAACMSNESLRFVGQPNLFTLLVIQSVLRRRKHNQDQQSQIDDLSEKVGWFGSQVFLVASLISPLQYGWRLQLRNLTRVVQLSQSFSEKQVGAALP